MIDGIWRSRGYGWILDVGAKGFAIHDVTEISRVRVDEGGPGSFEAAFEAVALDRAGALSLRQRGDVTTYWFDRVALPFAPDANSLDPVHNFEVFWRIFGENYAFFDLRGVDWVESYRRLRPRVSAGSSDETLLDAFAELIAPLRDAHVSLTAPGRVLDVTSPIRERKLKMQEAFDVPAWMSDRLTYTRRLQSAFGEMFLGGNFKTTTNSMMIYGEIVRGIGYVTLFGEFGHADTDRARAALDLPRPRLEAASFLADELLAIDGELDEVATALRGMRAIIVDARLNYGGYDRLALAFASRFTDAPRVAYRKKVWTPQGFVSHQAIEFAPRRPGFAHVPVFLLTSKQTVSAGEVLVLAMKACPNVMTIGETTLGILSDNLYKRLPNGWEVSLSNEVYEAADDQCFEVVGIPPDIDAPVFDPADVREGFRSAVNCALDLITSRGLT